MHAAREPLEHHRHILETVRGGQLDFGFRPLETPRILEAREVNGLREIRHPLQLLLPVELDRYGGRRYFLEPIYCFPFNHHGREDITGPIAVRHIHADLVEHVASAEGAIEFPSRETVRVTPGTRRPPPLDSSQIAELVYVNQFGTDIWHFKVSAMRLYPECIAPELREADFVDPASWASAALRVAHGYGTVAVTNDYAPRHLDHAYSEAARIVGNTRESARDSARTYDLTPSRQELLEYGFTYLSRSFPSECAMFLMEFADVLSVSLLRAPAVAPFFERFEELLDNGLRIERVIELFADCLERGLSATRALEHLAVVTVSIFGGTDRPWWFKEDFDLRSLAIGSPESVEAIARAAGPAFREVRSYVAEFQRRLVLTGALDNASALELIAGVGRSYGIGNEPRARKVLEYVASVLEEQGDDSPNERLPLLMQLLDREKPETEMIGVLEGPECSVHQPGVLCLLPVTGSTRLEAENTPTLLVDDLRAVAQTLALPLAVRAPLKPPLRDGISYPVYLTDGSLPLALSLRPDESITIPASRYGPLTSLLRFDARLHDEASRHPNRVADAYFTLCASKLLNPLDPPAGFITRVERFQDLPTAGYVWPYFAHPSERELVAKDNVHRIARQMSLLANLTELGAIGVLSWNRIEQILDWVTSPPREAAQITHPDYEDEPPLVAPRLRQLEAALRFLLPIAPAIAAGQMRAEPARRIVDVLLERDFTYEQLHGLSGATSGLATFDRIDEFRRSGFLDMRKMGEVLGTVATYEDVDNFGCDLLHAVAAFTEIEGDCKALVTRVSRSDMALEWLVEERNRLYERVEKRIGRHPFVADDAGRLMMRAWCWIDRYLEPLAQVTAFRRSLEKPREHPYEYTPAESVAAATTSVLGVWYANALLALSPNVDPAFVVAPDAVALHSSSIAASALELARRVPEMRRSISELRRDSFALYAVGGKIHVIHPIDPDRLTILARALGFDSTSFRLLHANRSLILPAMPSADELALVIRFLDVENVIDWDHPELQISIPGRLPPPLVAVLGASILLSTEEGVKYNRASFATTHDAETDFRITVYDAGGYRIPYPFEPTEQGRTDILGRRHLNDIRRYQLLGTVLGHGVEGGPYGGLSGQFQERFAAILRKAGLSGVLVAPWVRNPEEVGNTAERHYDQAVAPCVSAWFECAANFRRTGQISGVVAETQALFDWLDGEVRGIREGLLTDPRYGTERAILLGVD